MLARIGGEVQEAPLISRKLLMKVMLGDDYDHLYCPEDCLGRPRAMRKMKMLDEFVAQERKLRKCKHDEYGPDADGDVSTPDPDSTAVHPATVPSGSDKTGDMVPQK